MTMFLKALLLPAVGGICLIFLTGTYSVYEKGLFSLLSYDRLLIETTSMFFVGSLITAVFGVPFLLIVDKFFEKYWFRYILGGCIASFSMLFLMTGPLFDAEKYWLRPMYWFNYVEFLLLVGPGLFVGVVFTGFLGGIERFCRCNKASNDVPAP